MSVCRVEDHDDLIQIFTEQTKALSGTYGSYFLADLIEAQDEENHAAVCEVSHAHYPPGFFSMHTHSHPCSDWVVRAVVCGDASLHSSYNKSRQIGLYRSFHV